MNNVAAAFLVFGCVVLVWRVVEAVMESWEHVNQDVAAEKSFVAACQHCNVDDTA